jgi:hypothetical protein
MHPAQIIKITIGDGSLRFIKTIFMVSGIITSAVERMILAKSVVLNGSKSSPVEADQIILVAIPFSNLLKNKLTKTKQQKNTKNKKSIFTLQISK